MNSILKAVPEDFRLLTEIGRLSFIESHGSSATEAEIDNYICDKYNYEAFKLELTNPDNNIHIIYYNNEPAGYSNIILNSKSPSLIYINNRRTQHKISTLRQRLSL